MYNHSAYSRHRHVHLISGSIREGLAPRVSGDAKIAAKQIRGSPRQRRSFIFPRVRPAISCPFFPTE